jgi:hypothetical protein
MIVDKAYMDTHGQSTLAFGVGECVISLAPESLWTIPLRFEYTAWN